MTRYVWIYHTKMDKIKQETMRVIEGHEVREKNKNGNGFFGAENETV